METTETVESLWRKRFDIAQPQKRQRLLQFYDVFLELIQSLQYQDEWTLVEMQQSSWWEHLRPKYRKWQEKPTAPDTIAEMQAAFQTSLDLFRDIQMNGVRDPLVMYIESGKRYLILGYRRLVICHVLGIELVNVLTHLSYDAYLRWRHGDTGKC